MISQRTRDALAVKKGNGVRLGRPRQLPADVVDRIIAMRNEGLSLRAIATDLTTDGVPTAHSGRWYAATVAAILRSAEPAEEAVSTSSF